MGQEVIAHDATLGEDGRLTVYYDGACPLCRREIGLYRRRRGADAVVWVDAARFESEMITPDLRRCEALARFHVRLPDGTLVSGAQGFGALWAALPGLRWLATLARCGAVRPVLEAAYRAFLKVRPAVQRLATWTDTRLASTYPIWIGRALRSDHAGQTGAVAIYLGILWVSRSSEGRRFAIRKLRAGRRRLQVLGGLLPQRERSKMLPMWVAAGFITGAVSAVFGPRTVYATVETVDTFVDAHYRRQREELNGDERWIPLREALDGCRRDELAHRDEAQLLGLGARRGFALHLWLRAVAIGARVGVAVARRV